MKKIVFVLEENTLFVSPTLDENTIAESRFFEMITYRLIPFLKMCDNLIKDSISFKLAMSISPIYCQMLKNKTFTSRYKAFLENKIEFAKKEEVRLLAELDRVNNMLGNEKFISKAPASKIEEEKEKLDKDTKMLEQLREQLVALEKR